MVFTRFEQSAYIGGQSRTTEIHIGFLAFNFEALVRAFDSVEFRMDVRF